MLVKLKRPDPNSKDYQGQFGENELAIDEANYVDGLEAQNKVLVKLLIEAAKFLKYNLVELPSGGIEFQEKIEKIGNDLSDDEER